jgi:hypothetical protein
LYERRKQKMNTLPWILAVIAYLVFSYSFALFNLYVWKRWVRIEKTFQKGPNGKIVTHDGKSYEIEIVKMSRLTAILWPSYLQVLMPESKEDVRANNFLINDSEDKRWYLLLMTLIGSVIKILHLLFFWTMVYGITSTINAGGKLFRVGLKVIARMPGAKKVL